MFLNCLNLLQYNYIYENFKDSQLKKQQTKFINMIISILWLVLYIHSINCESTIINLSYVSLQNDPKRYSIQLSFNSSQTFTPNGLSQLSLPDGYIVQMNTKAHPQSQTAQNKQKIIIGLKQPSQFLIAVSNTFNIQLNEIQISTQDYTKLILKDISFVQSREIFNDNQLYDIRVIYNYGQGIKIFQKPCQLIDGSQIYFNQILIRQILNQMSSQNKIHFSFNQTDNTILLSGNLDNFPKITLIRSTYLFQLQIFNKQKLHYIPSKANLDSANIVAQNSANGFKTVSIKQNYGNQQTTKVGIKNLGSFEKFQIQGDDIIFKRTSLLYLLYLFFAYFFIFTLGTLIFARKNIFQAMQFVKNIMKWAFFSDNRARVQVLRTQLQ